MSTGSANSNANMSTGNVSNVNMSTGSAAMNVNANNYGNSMQKMFGNTNMTGGRCRNRKNRGTRKNRKNRGTRKNRKSRANRR